MLLIGDDFAYANGSSDFKILDLMYNLLNNYSQIDLGVQINVKIATPSDFFKQLKNKIQEREINVNKLSYDFSQYDENSHHLDKFSASQHRIDYWTGYHNNRGSHKQLIKRAFHYLEHTKNFLFLFYNANKTNLDE